MGVERLFKSFLARNGRGNSQGVRFLRVSRRTFQVRTISALRAALRLPFDWSRHSEAAATAQNPQPDA
jgi:hypothetical protein